MVEKFEVMDTVTKFKQQGSLTISKSLAILIPVAFVGCLVATGLLVYTLSSCENYVQKEESKLVICDQNPVKNEETTTTSKSTSTAPTTTTPKIEPEHLNLRLPRSIVPNSYVLQLLPFLEEGNFTFSGRVVIEMNVTETCKNITLHSIDLNILSVDVYDKESNSVRIKSIEEDKKVQFLVISLAENIISGQQYYVKIVFDGVLNDMMRGFYRSSYEENNQTRWIASTQFQPTDARRAFPCFDEPALKAKFSISIARMKNMTSVSNMKKYGSSSVKDLPEYVMDNYESTLPMSTYLLAFMVTDFKSISNGTFSIWARAGAINQAKYSLSVGPQILNFYEDFFGTKYVLPKLDMAAIPDFAAGAMENWGLITYREPVLLYEEGVSTRYSQQRIGIIIAHEIAHQWFGNLVTPTWWTDLWLNEGFATFAEYLGADAVQPEWKNEDLFVVNELQTSLILDALKSSHPISIQIQNPNEVNEIFDAISYSKGAAVIRMMQHFLTEETFHRALNKYLISKSFKAAEQDDLWETMTTQGHEEETLDEKVTVKDIMDTWTLQTGFPLVNAERTYEVNKSITFKQERFFLDNNTKDDSVWWVPVTYTDKTGEVNKTWIEKQPSQNVDINTNKEDWILVNVNQTGFYRVNYDEHNWKLIIDQLRKPNGHLAFNSKNRAQIMDDLLNLAFSGYVSYDLALNATLYLPQENDYIPWKAARKNLEFLHSRFERSAHFAKYKSYMLKLIENFYSKVGFREQRDPLVMMTQLELVDLACVLGLRDCIIQAVQMFQNWKNSANPDKENYIPIDLRMIVYCTAIADGGQEEWDFTWQRYLRTNVGNDKEILLRALGCTKEVWLLNRYLEWSITENSGIRKHDTSLVFATVAMNPIGSDLAYRFFKTNWDRIRNYFGHSSMFLSSIVATSVSHFNTQMEVDDFKAFFKLKYDKFGIANRTAHQAIEEVEANVKWMQTYFKTVLNWFNQNAIY